MTIVLKYLVVYPPHVIKQNFFRNRIKLQSIFDS